MRDLNLYGQTLYEVISKKNNCYYIILGTFSDLDQACIAIHEHIDLVKDDEIKYFVNVYNYSYTLEHKLGGCKHEE